MRKKNRKKYPGINNGGKKSRAYIKTVAVEEKTTNEPLLSRSGFKKKDFVQLM